MILNNELTLVFPDSITEKSVLGRSLIFFIFSAFPAGHSLLVLSVDPLVESVYDLLHVSRDVLFCLFDQLVRNTEMRLGDRTCDRGLGICISSESNRLADDIFVIRAVKECDYGFRDGTLTRHVKAVVLSDLSA